MSVERLARRAFWRVLFYRFLGEVVIAFPRRCFFQLYELTFELEKIVFYAELDAARAYKNLTDIDLASSSGDIRRYSGLDNARVARLTAQAFDGGDAAGDD